MTADYEKNYRILGIEPGAGWNQVRRAYKKQINVWHPDRFQQDPRRKKLAEEKSKQITKSYQELAEYYRKFGHLPPPAARHAPAPTSEPPAPAAPAAVATSEAEAPETTPIRGTKSRQANWRVRLLVALALPGAVYFLWQLVPQEEYLLPADELAARPPTGVESDPAAAGERHFFTIGSSLGEVYTAQGVPTRTENDVWYYGKSKVYFANGKVVRWEEHMEHPLKASLVPVPGNSGNRFFSQGSSKNEVIAAQGHPDRDAGNVWDYGASRVYFEGDRVTGWDEAPLYPLRVRQ